MTAFPLGRFTAVISAATENDVFDAPEAKIVCEEAPTAPLLSHLSDTACAADAAQTNAKANHMLLMDAFLSIRFYAPGAHRRVHKPNGLIR